MACLFHIRMFFHVVDTITQLMSSEEPDIMVTLLHGTLGNLCRKGSLHTHRTLQMLKWAGRVVLGF